MQEQEWKDRFVAEIKKRFRGPEWTEDEKQKQARMSADACWPSASNGDFPEWADDPEQAANDEADEMHD